MAQTVAGVLMCVSWKHLEATASCSPAEGPSGSVRLSRHLLMDSEMNPELLFYQSQLTFQQTPKVDVCFGGVLAPGLGWGQLGQVVTLELGVNLRCGGLGWVPCSWTALAKFARGPGPSSVLERTAGRSR